MKEKMHRGIRLFLIGEIFMVVGCFAVLYRLPNCEGLSLLAFLSLVGLVLNIISLCKLAKVNGYFLTALIVTILGLVLAGVSVGLAFVKDPSVELLNTMEVLMAVSRLSSIATTAFVIEGMNAFFKENAGDGKIQKVGKVTEWSFTIAILISVVVGSVLPLFNSIKTNTTLMFALSIVSLATLLISYIIFVVYLVKATKATK